MRLILIHNPSAGDGQHNRTSLQEAIQAAGHEILATINTKEDSLQEALALRSDLVVAAGGDGTIARVARCLAGDERPLAIVPLGTANNIASSLGISGDIARLARGWRAAPKRALDLGRASGPWGERRFLEGVGLGVFARALRDARKKDGPGSSLPDRLERDLQHFSDVCRRATALPCRIRVDGRELSGRYLLVEVLNTPLWGPRLSLASGTDPGDGLLDVVSVAVEQRDQLLAYLSRATANHPIPLPFEALRGRQIQLAWEEGEAHIDDHLWRTEESTAPLPLQATIDAAAGSVYYLAAAQG